MKVEIIIDRTVKFLADPKNQNHLRFDDEYQRAAIWKKPQKQMFIDSILRGYSIPAFYFYFKGSFQPAGEEEAFSRYDVIDGQQRIRAIQEFYEDGFDLLDPNAEKDEFKFPNLVKGEKCDWAKKTFSQLEDLKETFLNQRIVIFEISTDKKDKVRDLFIRLQGGTPLSAQDKRDAWPGKFTKYILQVAGKKALSKAEGRGTIGWPFFREVVRNTTESQKRALAAQLAMIYFNKMESNQKEFTSIKSKNIDSFYHSRIDFDDDSETARDFRRNLEKLTLLLGNRTQKLQGHEAIHLILLVDLLTKGYASGWEDYLLNAFVKFRDRCRQAYAARNDDQDHEFEDYSRRYMVWTRTSSDESSTIAKRHEFFLSKMLELLSPHLKKRDSQRIFGDIERDIIYERDHRQCQWCKMKNERHTVFWDEMEIHHVEPHHQGGATQIENGALMHKDCHPRDGQKVDQFKEWWFNKRDPDTYIEEDGSQQKRTIKGKQLTELPDETKCRFVYRGEAYLGQITKGKIYIDNIEGKFNSLSAASGAITHRSSNGWRDWQIFFPEKDMWIIADDWRQGFDL